jgi:hypothetical protein
MIRAAEAVDLILESDSRPSYPKLMYQAVERVDRKILTEDTKDICADALGLWNGASSTCAKALQGPDVDLRRDVEETRRTMLQLDLWSVSSSGACLLGGEYQVRRRAGVSQRDSIPASSLQDHDAVVPHDCDDNAGQICHVQNTYRFRTRTKRLVESSCPQCKLNGVLATLYPIVHSHKASLRMFSCLDG